MNKCICHSSSQQTQVSEQVNNWTEHFLFFALTFFFLNVLLILLSFLMSISVVLTQPGTGRWTSQNALSWLSNTFLSILSLFLSTLERSITTRLFVKFKSISSHVISWKCTNKIWIYCLTTGFLGNRIHFLERTASIITVSHTFLKLWIVSCSIQSSHRPHYLVHTLCSI